MRFFYLSKQYYYDNLYIGFGNMLCKYSSTVKTDQNRNYI